MNGRLVHAVRAIIFLLASMSFGCAESHVVEAEGPWLERAVFGRFEGGELQQATCEDLPLDRVHIRVAALYDVDPEGIDEEVHCSASFDVDRSIFDGELHAIRGSVDIPELARDPDEDGVVFTPEEGNDPAIERAVAIPWMIFDAPTGRLELTGQLRLDEPCPTGSIQVAVEGDLRFGRTEAFMPIEPEP